MSSKPPSPATANFVYRGVFRILKRWVQARSARKFFFAPRSETASHPPFSYPPFSHQPPFRIPPLLDLIGSVVWMKRCKKTTFLHPPLRVGAKIQGVCETKGGCKGPKRPTLNTPMGFFHWFCLGFGPRVEICKPGRVLIP